MQDHEVPLQGGVQAQDVYYTALTWPCVGPIKLVELINHMQTNIYHI